MTPPPQISAVILAGGRGRRMGCVDKGLLPMRGKPMVQWAIERLAPQVDELLINANQNLDDYRAFGFAVHPDAIAGFAGPLAGLHSGLRQATHPLVATVPCDSPFLPHDLVVRLAAALTTSTAQIAVARTGEQAHPVFCLCRRALLPRLEAYLDEGGRSAMGWLDRVDHVFVSFDDQAAAFSNLNTPAELYSWERAPTDSDDRTDTDFPHVR